LAHPHIAKTGSDDAVDRRNRACPSRRDEVSRDARRDDLRRGSGSAGEGVAAPRPSHTRSRAKRAASRLLPAGKGGGRRSPD